MKKNFPIVISLVLIIAAAAALIVFGVCNFSYTDDLTLNALLNSIIPRLTAGAALLAVMVILGCRKILLPYFKSLHKQLLWCIPCFLVALANFPFTALIGGSASITRSDLIALFILECISIGFLEEILFRGLVQDTVSQLFENKPRKHLLTVAVTSAIFALVHLLNIFSGANIGATLLQVGYCFLLGAMLSAVLIKTGNIWLCVLIHAAFDTGGNIVTELGAGTFQDLWFWIFTAVAGLICFAHVLYFLLKADKCEK